MPDPPGHHISGAIDPPDDEQYDSSGNSSDMKDSLDIVGRMVKAFLATRDTRPNGRADVIFDQVSVEGSGKGVCSPHQRW